MSWATDVMEIAAELQAIAERPVILEPQNYDHAVGCRIEGIEGGAKVMATQYHDPNDGYWYELKTSINDYLTPEQIENLETKSLSVTEAQEALRNYVRKAVGRLN